MSIFVKEAGDLPPVQKSIFRNLISLILAYRMIRRDKLSLRVEKQFVLPMMGRAIFGTVGVYTNFYIVDNLLLSDAAILSKLTPFISVFFSMWLLKERASRTQIACSVVAFAGCFLVAQPTMGTKDLVPYMIGTAGMATVSLAYTCLRYLGQHKVKKQLIVFYFSLTSTAVAIPITLMDPRPMSLWQIAMLMMAGVCATVGQLCVTSAYSFAPAKEISVFDYSSVLFSALIGVVLYDQIPDRMSWLGYLVIFGAAGTLFWTGREKPKTAA